MTHHHLDASEIHRRWDRSLPPRLTVESGDSVTLAVRQGVDGYCGRNVVAAELTAPFPGHPLTGPIEIADARPGDVLEIRVDDIVVDDWGLTISGPGYGLLPDLLDVTAVQRWEIAADGRATCLPGVEVDVAPFPGVMGCAPDLAGDHSTFPPRRVGGNLDCRHLTAGSTLWLPVEVPGALFSVGDAHAAQGNGEVGGTAIETGFPSATFTFTLHQDRHLDAPEFRSTRPAPPGDGGVFATTGVEPDLLDASRLAIRRMIDHLGAERGIGVADAYMLCGVVVDLEISEVVNEGVYVVSAVLPDAVFVD